MFLTAQYHYAIIDTVSIRLRLYHFGKLVSITGHNRKVSVMIMLIMLPMMIFPFSLAEADDVCNIGSRLELFVDDYLIDKMDGVSLKLHNPIPREVAIVFDSPHDGNTSAYVTVFQDDDIYRMYYRGSAYDFANKKDLHELTCYAESKDGINWYKPELDLYEFDGSTKNNIIWRGIGIHNFTPFKDTNPNVDSDAKYKALGGLGSEGLIAFKSSDGIHWVKIQDKPVITKGAFDSQNLAFWNPVTECYMDFHRDFKDGIRQIMTCTSKDFINWTEPQWIDFGDAPLEHLYTNAVTPYYRAPHILMGFPKRFAESRKKLSQELWTGVSDGVYMTSRDGLHWHRWLEAFIRPGLQMERWGQRNNMTAYGILVTESGISNAPKELSIYSSEAYCMGNNRLRRYTLRIDGFVSVNASYKGGELLTKPFIFDGKELVINYSTSAVGSVRVEITDKDGNAISGFNLNDCPEIYGDEIEKIVQWKTSSDVSLLAGQVVRLRFILKDADLYSIRFR